ncbi:DUF4164 domain-containing protein [Methylobrevis pamukkalensis]|uniref:DUF4164 family protein n=1 Tax=Methylobrevis pamukkalensis TaxID=1439726 RepID=A0A1E3H150_9HYPH|nr:DUF4164 domain-containing protein [Methylobrevis pamukkalensis]ODN70053.1 hypothetical protein A6302_02650 [Methylobrevis pamukkalensis]
MAEGGSFEAAVREIEAALGRLEAAVARRGETERALGDLEIEFSRLGEDRSRLVQELDNSAARAGRLEEANREVSRRLVAAMESIRAVLDAHGG